VLKPFPNIGEMVFADGVTRPGPVTDDAAEGTLHHPNKTSGLLVLDVRTHPNRLRGDAFGGFHRNLDVKGFFQAMTSSTVSMRVAPMIVLGKIRFGASLSGGGRR